MSRRSQRADPAAHPGRRAPVSPEHHRRWLIRTVLSVTLVLVAIVGGPWVYARFFAPEPREPLAVSSPAPSAVAGRTPTTVPVAELDGTWSVSEGSEAGYRLEEVLSGEDVTVVGRTDQVSGTVETRDGTLTAAEVVVDVASVGTDEAARDAYFRRALDTSSFPEATFVLDQPVDVADLAGTAEPVTAEADGTLTFHGVSQKVTASLEIQRTARSIEVAGTVPVELADFGLEAPDLGFVVVEPEGLVEMLLVLTQG